jgi:hypothetical protein
MYLCVATPYHTYGVACPCSANLQKGARCEYYRDSAAATARSASSPTPLSLRPNEMSCGRDELGEESKANSARPLGSPRPFAPRFRASKSRNRGRPATRATTKASPHAVLRRFRVESSGRPVVHAVARSRQPPTALLWRSSDSSRGVDPAENALASAAAPETPMLLLFKLRVRS